MKFLCLVHFEPDAFAGFTPEDGRRLTDATILHDHELREAGHLLFASPLAAAETEVSLKRRNRVDIDRIDGPFAESREVVGGFILIEADDMDQAISLLAESPIAPFARLQIRPLKEDDRHSETGAARPALKHA